MPPKSRTTAQFVGVEWSPKVTPMIWMGEVPAQAGALYDWQKVWPAMQNWLAGLVKGEVWPISQTKALGVSKTLPPPRALPISWVSKAGISSPASLELSTIVPDWRVLWSVTVTWKPSAPSVVYQCTVILSPA